MFLIDMSSSQAVPELVSVWCSRGFDKCFKIGGCCFVCDFVEGNQRFKVNAFGRSVSELHDSFLSSLTPPVAMLP